jgi:DNA-binding cell septation regulator SpoVG
MHITIEHHNDQFNVSLSSAQGKEPFITVKGCRIVDGQKGRFVSWPARKLENGSYWRHVYASDGFQAAVIEAFDKSTKKPAKARNDDDAPPF